MVVYVRGESSVAPQLTLSLICPFLYFVIETALFKHFCYVSRVFFCCMISYTYGIFEKKKKRLKISSPALYLVVDDLNDKDITYRVGKWSWMVTTRLLSRIQPLLRHSLCSFFLLSLAKMLSTQEKKRALGSEWWSLFWNLCCADFKNSWKTIRRQT